jgi:hypothetical protein
MGGSCGDRYWLTLHAPKLRREARDGITGRPPSPDASSKQFSRIPQRTPPRQLADLTGRELDVLRLISRGVS